MKNNVPFCEDMLSDIGPTSYVDVELSKLGSSTLSKGKLEIAPLSCSAQSALIASAFSVSDGAYSRAPGLASLKRRRMSSGLITIAIFDISILNHHHGCDCLH